MSENLKQYEIMLLMSPELSETDVKKEISNLKSTITKHKGEVSFEDYWGKRKLAYRIQKEDLGYYHVMLFTYPGSELKNLEDDLKLNKSVMRHLVSIPPKEYQPITFGEVEASEERYYAELAAKKAGKKKKKPVAKSAPEKPKVHKEVEEESKDTAEERAKKLDKILSEDLNI